MLVNNIWVTPNKLFKSIIFSGLENNVFNKKYVSNGYYGTYDDTWSVPGQTTTLDYAGYYPQATINFLLGMTLKFYLVINYKKKHLKKGAFFIYKYFF